MGKVESVQVPVFETDGPGYEADFAAWSEEQARRLRLLRVPGLDLENVAEEIESLSRSDKREMSSRLTVLLTHLLKWQHQSDLTGRSWRSTIGVQRSRIAKLLKESQSLRPAVRQMIEEAYPDAVKDAVIETGLFEDSSPAGCEWSSDQVLDDCFLPQPRS